MTAKVGANPDIRLSTVTVDGLFSDGGTLLAGADSPQDIECTNVIYKRLSSSNLSDGMLPLSINVREDYNRAAARGYTLNFIGAINQCGNIHNVDLRGCQTGGRMYIEYPIRAPVQTIVHEWGHFKGLGHAPKTPQNTWRIMYFRYNANRSGVTPSECRTLTGTVGAQADLASTAEESGNETEGLTKSGSDRLNEFLLEMWLHGLPVPEIMELTADDIAQIRSLVASGVDLNKLPNAVAILGLRGGKDDIGLLRQLLDRLANATDPAAQETLLYVPIAIGRIVGRIDSEEGMAFLRNLAISAAAERYTSNSGVPERIFRENALIGLAYTRDLEEALAASGTESNTTEAATNSIGATPGFQEMVEEISSKVKEYGVIEKISRDNELQNDPTGNGD